jgi:hypothetical protein
MRNKGSGAKERLARKRKALKGGACKRKALTERRRKEDHDVPVNNFPLHPNFYFPFSPLYKALCRHSAEAFLVTSSLSQFLNSPSLIDFALCVQGHRVCLGRCNNTESTMVSFHTLTLSLGKYRCSGFRDEKP